MVVTEASHVSVFRLSELAAEIGHYDDDMHSRFEKAYDSAAL
jgi:hypothetical protein